MHQIISRHCSYVSYGSLFLFILGSIREVSFLLLNLVTIVVLGKTTESPLDSKETKSVNPNGNQPWIFIGRTDAEAEAPIHWPPDVKSWLIWKDPGAGEDWRQEEKRTTENEMIGWHHWLDGHGFGWSLGVGDGQGGLACYGSWGRKESDMTEWLNWTELIMKITCKNNNKTGYVWNILTCSLLYLHR